MEGGCPGKRWQGLNPGSGLDEWLTEISDNIEKRWEVRGGAEDRDTKPDRNQRDLGL